MSVFIGRERELERLNARYQSNQFEFAVFYGRRRVGKTTLIKEFIQGKPAFYYMALEGTRKENLSGLSKVLLGNENDMAVPEFSDFETLLGYLDQLSRKQERCVVVIDEFPYLAASYPSISSMLQSHIDQCWKNGKLFLILCGSSMSFMEEQVLGYKSPLYGRRTAQFKIKPFTYFETCRMLPGFTPEEQAILHGITDGIPEYLSRIDPNKTMDQNIIDLFFDESGRLFEEPANLLKQELREPASYHSIITAIAGGASRMNEIATKTGLETSGCSNQITALINLGIVKKEVPITDAPAGRKTLYRLEDSMFLFWYRFVRSNASSISRGIGETIYWQIVKPQLSDFMGSVFEEICKQFLYLPQIYATLPFPVGEIGRWWGNNPQKKRQEEIDLMAVLDNQAFFGECKWRNEPIDAGIIQTLIERGNLFHYEKKYYFLFSKTGYTAEAIKMIRSADHIRLYSLDQIHQAV